VKAVLTGVQSRAESAIKLRHAGGYELLCVDMYQSPNRVVSQDKQAGGRPDRRRLLDLDRDRGAEQAADQLSRRRPGCGIRANVDGRSSRPIDEPSATDD
jgi:hypothetical protein